MVTIEYPSSNFRQAAEELIKKHESFTVIIPSTSKKNVIVKHKLDALFGRRPRTSGRFKRIVETWRISDFFAALAAPLRGKGYRIQIEDRDDLMIHFTAI
jgi:hypothetical protein